MQILSNPGSSALRKGRVSLENNVYFVTTITHQRIPWFQVFSFARIMCKSLGNEKVLTDATCLCWVVMPDHIHLLLQLADKPISRVVNQLKSYSARLLNQEIGRSGRFWDHGFHDHALRREETLVEVARYIVANPLRAGLVKRYGDYPYWDAVWV
jgi:REP element-mobilizing transposase RayT